MGLVLSTKKSLDGSKEVTECTRDISKLATKSVRLSRTYKRLGEDTYGKVRSDGQAYASRDNIKDSDQRTDQS